MSTLRVNKKENPYAQVDRALLHDTRLSWKAKGIMAYLLSKKDDWQVYISQLVKESKDGKDATTSGINELIDLRYIVRSTRRDENGKFAGYDYDVFEEPQPEEDESESGSPESGFPEVGKAESGKPVSGKTDFGKPATNKKDYTKKEVSKKDKTKKEETNPDPAVAGVGGETEPDDCSSEQEGTDTVTYESDGAPYDDVPYAEVEIVVPTDRHPNEAKAERKAAKGKADRFEDWWQSWPAGFKRSKQGALKAWEKAGLDACSDFLAADVERRFETVWKEKEPQFVPHPSTYLNGERWNDDLPKQAPRRSGRYRPPPIEETYEKARRGAALAIAGMV